VTQVALPQGVAVDLPVVTAPLRSPVARALLPLVSVVGAIALWEAAVAPADAVGAALPLGRVPLLVAGALMLATAPVAARRHPATWFAWWLTLCGPLLWTAVLVGMPASSWAVAGAVALDVVVPMLFWTLVTAPRNGPGSRAAVALLVTTGIGAAVASAADAGLADPLPLRVVAASLVVVALVPTAVVLRRRWRGVPYVLMGSFAPLFAVVPLGLVAWALAEVTIAQPGSAPSNTHVAAVTVFQLVLVGQAIAAAKVFVVMLARAIQAAEFVATIQATPLDQLEATLRRGLRDPTLELARVGEDGVLVNAAGQPCALPDPDSSALVTSPLRRDGRLLGAVVHGRGVQDDAEVLRAVLAAVALTLDNQRLAAEAEERLAETRASRVRIVAAADEARRRVERDLHDGAQARLVAATLELRTLQWERGTEDAGITEVLAQLDAALVELRDLARGLYPASLSAGIGTALRVLAERSPVPVRLLEVPETRFEEPVEQCVYFLVSEALTNVAKHARATTVDVRVSFDRNVLVVSVADDGVGGAETGGAGLQGLADRIGALGGVLDVASPPGGGTRITASIPIDERSSAAGRRSG
jgi:signal transduction histidine kinase